MMTGVIIGSLNPIGLKLQHRLTPAWSVAYDLRRRSRMTDDTTFADMLGRYRGKSSPVPPLDVEPTARVVESEPPLTSTDALGTGLVRIAGEDHLPRTSTSSPATARPTIFAYNDTLVRAVMIDGEPWWIANDVCAALGIDNPRMALTRLDEDGVSQTDVIDALGRTQRTNIVNEPGLYELIFRSDKPEARTFRRWVTREVLPSIRKTGAYLTPDTEPDTAALTDLYVRLDRLERLVGSGKPAAVPGSAPAPAPVRWYSTGEAGAVLGLSASGVRKRCDSGKIPHIRKASGHRLISVETLRSSL